MDRFHLRDGKPPVSLGHVFCPIFGMKLSKGFLVTPGESVDMNVRFHSYRCMHVYTIILSSAKGIMDLEKPFLLQLKLLSSIFSNITHSLETHILLFSILIDHLTARRLHTCIVSSISRLISPLSMRRRMSCMITSLPLPLTKALLTERPSLATSLAQAKRGQHHKRKDRHTRISNQGTSPHTLGSTPSAASPLPATVRQRQRQRQDWPVQVCSTRLNATTSATRWNQKLLPQQHSRPIVDDSLECCGGY